MPDTLTTDPTEAFETWRDRQGMYGRMSFIRNAHTTWHAAIHWVLQQQLMWDSLTEAEAIEELRKGEASIFYPLFHGDATIWADCPRDGRVTVTKTGICDRCLYDFSEAA